MRGKGVERGNSVQRLRRCPVGDTSCFLQGLRGTLGLTVSRTPLGGIQGRAQSGALKRRLVAGEIPPRADTLISEVVCGTNRGEAFRCRSPSQFGLRPARIIAIAVGNQGVRFQKSASGGIHRRESVAPGLGRARQCSLRSWSLPTFLLSIQASAETVSGRLPTAPFLK